MKLKRFIKKMPLNKITVANLNDEAMNALKGGSVIPVTISTPRSKCPSCSIIQETEPLVAVNISNVCADEI